MPVSMSNIIGHTYGTRSVFSALDRLGFPKAAGARRQAKRPSQNSEQRKAPEAQKNAV